MSSSHDIPFDMTQAPFLVPDPGTGNAIVVSRWNQTVPLRVAGTETNTLANPLNANQRVRLVCEIRSAGTRTVTVAAAFNQAGNTTIAFDAVGESAILESVPSGYESDNVTSKFRWKLVHSDGATLG